jgi:DNA-binding response OmpR family regulator
MPSRVLVADDDRAIRESLARALELEGYDVAVVADGRLTDHVTHLDQRQPDPKLAGAT